VKLIFLGPPGIGKGTVTDRIKDDYNLEKISTGDLFRENIKNKTPLGVEAQKHIIQGHLVPDEITISMVKEKLKGLKNYILDGFPRTIPQAEALSKIAKIDYVVNFYARDETLLMRLSGRRICPKCNTIYHLTNIPPKIPGICDKDGEKLIQREDDKPAKIKERLNVYETQTKPLIDFYRKKGIIVDVDTDQPLPGIISDTLKVVGLK
jgi:adenylate kinase